MTGPAVELRDLFRIHSSPEGSAAALQGLSLAVREGEILVVLGPSGSGKTTLLRILAGLDTPSAGSVRVFGEEIGRLSPHALGAYRTTTIGYADQHYSRALEPELTARELVALQPGLRGVPAPDRLRRADELLDRVGLHAKRRSRPAELSGGEQQRVAVCAALAHGPRLFLADEPTGELDTANAELVYGAIADLVGSRGCTTVIVSHDPESATIADRVVRIRDGRVSEESTREAGGEGAIVVGRGGWLRLPEEFLRRAGIRERATARFHEDAIVVRSAEPVAPAAEPDRSVGAESEARPREVVAEVRGLTRRYGAGPAATVALQELTASFGSGRLCAVTGPSGSGKTTLLHLLAGLDLPTDGEVVVLGTELGRLDRDARAGFRRERIGLVGQQPGLIPFLSARENVELALALRGVDGDEARARAVDTLASVGLAERAEQRVSRLSTGERGRVAIARALAPRPSLLLADEPTSRLDQANAIAVAGLLAGLARDSGATIVCATHDPVVIEHADEELKLQAPATAPAAAAIVA
jgi:ABC-type lipoprotein export system ATPase subunit